MILNLPDILFSFTFFSILGWFMEVCYRSVCAKRFVNPGLLKGPYLILYGAGGVTLMLSVSFIHEYNIFVKAVYYFLITTGLELISGFNARHFFNVRLWDYSDQRFQFKGYICLRFSIYWILLAFAFEYLLLPVYLGLTGLLSSPVKGVSGMVALILMTIDFSKIVRGKQRVKEEHQASFNGFKRGRP